MNTLSRAPLLIELLTEELPPKALARLGETFALAVRDRLADAGLSATDAPFEWFATPRRLAVLIPQVAEAAAEAAVDEKIMPVSVALDAAGGPTPALLKKLASKGIAPEAIAEFEKRQDGKAESFFYRFLVPGARLDAVLGGIVSEALKKLPIPKVMRWGASDIQFVRPVHGLVMLHGGRVVPGEALGLSSGRATRGHRFLSQGELVLEHAEAYAALLFDSGKVIASFDRRRESIRKQLQDKADRLGARAHLPEALLDEVTALTEWPVVHVGEFEAEYLAVPQECLILTMQQNQKYFPLLNADGSLQNRFLIVSNMETADPRHIIAGNARVVRPRLADARFFFEQDRRQALSARVEKLSAVVYHNKLGTQRARVARLESLAGDIAARLGSDADAARRAALLAKADLTTDMVGEFPELQGIMGRYYARADGENPVVADAIEAHYKPRFAGDELPSGNIAAAVALADKLDVLTGFFGIGQIPTGDKDPFALRRAALGVLRILIETPLPLGLDALIAAAGAQFAPGVLTPGFEETLFDFLLDRLRGYLRDAGHAPDAIEAVCAQRPARIDTIPAKLTALAAFSALDAAQALAAANKRIGNILKKTGEASASASNAPDVALLQEDAEKALFERLLHLSPLIRSHVENGAYAQALQGLATVRPEVDAFFDEVMVMTEEPLLRANRLNLLRALFEQLNAVADLSKLSA
ncbi:MAG: glycine--tRNA ligase subunit beta [Betaproteobacteria bacterium]|nr:glycine--tRNA ligase subunit beta [Betaproteobacteria bacterium]